MRPYFMIDKELLTSYFTTNQNTYWPCSNGYLVINEDTFFSKETSVSQKVHPLYESDPESVRFVYSCIFRCSNNNCNEQFASSGHGCLDWDIEEDDYGMQQQVYSPCFEPYYFYPSLKIIDIPENVPDDITNQLNKSFELFFSSPSAAINHARSALELILNHFKIPKTTINNKNKRVKINLHNRIDKLAKQNSELKELLLAIKWIGNEGSHPEKRLTKNDVIDLYEILEHVLSELFENKSKTILAKAKKINKAKGIK
ncbi:conserved hypothetical protein [Psychrobacter cryohalolentis K5]|uniref:DUF4145 domain-containing protein n=2 Tax=Psychrobacter cryohalolentis TaxID=330922 RepID=Q1QBQ1_PSYCK|nr:conserved hypothetical protein [Psychrobacter cryohalolentis K5]ASE25113.1 DUF4145 domain-containing protein [Psychrobacter cryohalolentis]